MSDKTVTPDNGNGGGNTATPNGGNGDSKSRWAELGFKSEEAMFDAAKEAGDLRRKIADAEAKVERERAARADTDSKFLSQANQLGAMRKKLAELGEKLPDDDGKEKGAEPKDKGEKPKPEDVLESISEEEAAILDGVLNDPKNAELKKRVALGGTAAMAEFVQAYRAEAPVDLSAPLFSSLKKKKAETVQKSSIAKEVKALFSQRNNEERNNLAASMPTGAPVYRPRDAESKPMVGGVTADYFIKK